MTLNYRGQTYNTNVVEAQPQHNKGTYRGVAVDFSAQASGDRAHGQLKYRGAAYAV